MTRTDRIAVRIAVGAVVIGALMAAPRSPAPFGGGVDCRGADGAAVCGIADADADRRP